MSGLLARIACAVAAELGEQDGGKPFALGPDLRLAYLDQEDVDLRKVARAMLTAIREPTGPMMEAADRMGYAVPPPVWTAMIDAALNEHDGLTALR